MRSLLHLGVPSLLLIGGVAGTAAAQSPPTAIDRLLGDPAWANSVVWNPTRPLRWEDFQAPVQPPHTGAQVASTWSGLAYAFQCDETRLEYAVLALFQPGESWVQPRFLRRGGKTQRVLAHEQGHFDIAEVEARRLRADLAAAAVPCAAAESTLVAEGALAVRRLDELQTRYDKQTEHGTDDGTQAQWLAWIRAALDTLAYAGRPTVSRPY